jgi:predicted P-loop ATPase
MSQHDEEMDDGELDDRFDGGLESSQEETAKERELRERVKDENKGMAAKIRAEPDIVKRARKLFMAGMIQFPDTKKVRSGDAFVVQPIMTDENKKTVLDALFENEEAIPRHDLFRGRVVDHLSELIDDHYSMMEWIKAFSAAGLKGTSADSLRKFLREWAFQHKHNDLIRRFEKALPEWDGKQRMETKLIEVFKCFDTPLNRSFGKYFWLSLYARAMMPGSLAPIVLSLFGAQGCGKSRFGAEIARIITCDPDADTVPLDLSGNAVEFLRNITGHSVVAAVGEMTGFTRGDLNKIKDFVTRTSDPMHHKFEGHFIQQRQWITILDGNKYEGLQRDDTGNRRFYPMFCGQLPDKLGKPDWSMDFVIEESIWDELPSDVWQLMAEASAWFDEKGERGYNDHVREVIKGVAAFSNAEMKRDRGTIQDDIFDVYLVPMLKDGPKLVWTKKDGTACVGVRTGEFKRFFMDTLKHVRPNWKHLKNKMTSLGAEEHVFTGGYPGFLFKQYISIADFVERVGLQEFVDTEGGKVTSVEDSGMPPGGF